MADTAVLIKADNLGRRTSDGKKWIIRGVTLALSTGQRVALVGPSGSGKTVLLRMLGLLDAQDEGTLTWQNKSIHQEGVPSYRSRVIYLHQRPAMMEGTVLENMMWPFEFRIHQHRVFDRQRVVYWLNVLGREADFLDKRTSSLSGGEMQIASLVRAMQLEPEVLLLDEPTSALDEGTTAAVETCVDRWQQQQPQKRSFVVVSHSREQVQRMVGRILSIQNGGLIERAG